LFILQVVHNQDKLWYAFPTPLQLTVTVACEASSEQCSSVAEAEEGTEHFRLLLQMKSIYACLKAVWLL